MSTWTLLAGLTGGVGLFLLGMTMLTDGLRLAAGPALERILAVATRTRAHALASGMAVTALVQSSSAVTLAAIGFVNAGLLSLGPALWVLFGSNVGTTTTGWLVALVGLRFKIETLALPLIGLGVVLKLTGVGQRRGALGSALAGFGLLFLGISMLQQAFTAVAAQTTLPQGTGLLAVAAQVAAGLAMTVLMQSSGASMAIALTAAQGGLLDTQGAAAVVIGANIGTTLTAVLAAIGATPNARRAAAAHVIFNLLTGAVAFALLPWLVRAIERARDLLSLPADPAVTLALFHSCFNMLGVLLMWPMAGALTRWLQARFLAREEDEAQPRHLDDNVLAVPSLAVAALEQEVGRLGHVAVRAARAVLAGAGAQAIARDQLIAARLESAAEAFVERVSRAAMTPATSQRLARVLRVQRYWETVAEQAQAAAMLARGESVVPAAEADFAQHADALLAACDGAVPPPGLASAVAAMGTAYQALKAALLDAGAGGRVRMAPMEVALRRYSALRRAAEQAAKAAVLAPSGAMTGAAAGFSDDAEAG
ncbi:MAG: Na/Pi symporter [Rubrivivax sp.]|nr:Na/Pi symporter [Rubrivivax sp.]